MAKLFGLSAKTKAAILMVNTIVQLVAKAMAVLVRVIDDNEVSLEEAVEIAGEVGANFLQRK